MAWGVLRMTSTVLSLSVCFAPVAMGALRTQVPVGTVLSQRSLIEIREILVSDSEAVVLKGTPFLCTVLTDCHHYWFRVGNGD